jgi:3-deoxy-D-manno-octulosonic-acid transferase
MGATGSASAPSAKNFTGRASGTHDDSASNPPRIILVDRIGELGNWWGTATIGFVGGSLTQRGGQNMIEPAAFGVATCFGPNTWNFRDVVQMFIANDASVVVRDARELEAFVRRCIAEPDFAKQLGQRAKSLVQKQQGATEKTLSLIQHFLSLLHPNS